MRTNAYSVGTVSSTLLTTPPNYSFRIDKLYINTTGTVNTAVDTLSLYSLGIGTINGNSPGSVFLGKFTVVSGSPTVIDGYEIERVPTGSSLNAVSVVGNITVTITGEYQYSRD
jgi:hypothetical protein